MNKVNYLPYENLDRLLQVEVRPLNLPSGVIPKLYKIARDEHPLSYVTAEAFFTRPTARVGIVTGVSFLPHLPHGEIDGLVGAVVLARALGRLGGESIILTEAGVVPVIEALIEALEAPKVSAVNITPLDSAELERYVQDVDIGVAIEKIGVNRKGVTHTIQGLPFTSESSYADDFIQNMNMQGKMTVGYGDGGNEIGFGKIFDAAREIVPYGATCQCPCGDGMITSTGTNVLWPVNVSNFGVYGTVAALAIHAEDLTFAFPPEELLRALDVAVAAGAKDGGTGQAIPGEDGIPAETAAAFVRIIYNIVDYGLREVRRPF